MTKTTISVDTLEDILEKVSFFDDYQEDEIEEVVDYLQGILSKDLNKFLSKIFNQYQGETSNEEYYRGNIINGLLKAGIEYKDINYDIAKKCIEKGFVLEVIDNSDDWEWLKEQSTYSTIDTMYKNHNFYELYVDVDNFSGDKSELISVFKNLKQLGEVYIMVTNKKQVDKELENAFYGVFYR